MIEEKAIEIIDKMIKSYIEADECGLSNNDFKYEIKAMQTVLNMLKEKDKEINCKSLTIKALQCALHERTEERDRKDYIIARQKEQIDSMAEKIFQEGIVWNDKEEVKQFYKRKATNDG